MWNLERATSEWINADGKTPVEEEAITILFFLKCLPFCGGEIWCNKVHSMPQNVVHFFCVHGVSSPNDEVGGCLVGSLVGPSVHWPSIHKPTKNCMLCCSLVIKFCWFAWKNTPPPLVRRSAPLFKQVFLFDSLMNS
jgi:hypothetical protein